MSQHQGNGKGKEKEVVGAVNGEGSNHNDNSAFVVVSENGDDDFTVYSTQSFGRSGAPMASSSIASSSKNPNGDMNWPPTDAEMRDQDAPRNASLKSSRAYSVASPAADKSRREPLRADNPDRIPTAGGVALGGRAAQEREYRRKSRMSMDMGKPNDDRLALDKEGSPDPITQNNTQANTIPARMNAENGDAGDQVEPDPELERKKSPSAPEVSTIPDATIEPVKPAAKVEATNGNSDMQPVSSSPKERRGSTLDNMLGKLGLGRKK